MKIVIGNTYTSNVGDVSVPIKGGGGFIYEKWTIHSQLPDGNYLAFCIKVDGTKMWREFKDDGADGLTQSGSLRKLLPNTRTVVKWGFIFASKGTQSSAHVGNMLVESKEQVQDWLKNCSSEYYTYTPVEIRYEVEE